MYVDTRLVRLCVPGLGCRACGALCSGRGKWPSKILGCSYVTPSVFGFVCISLSRGFSVHADCSGISCPLR